MQSVLHKTLERITRETGLVGGVTALFKDGKVLFTDCYGYADRESGRLVTPTSSFDIASCSKAWTVMLAAQAVDEGLLGWDDPIRRVIPEFALADPYAGEHLSIRDLSSHRSGVPCHDFLRNKIGTSRYHLMRKTEHLEFSAGFRETYQYNNHMYIVLGYLLEALHGGKPWEQQVQARIADRLGVKTIRFRGLPHNMENLECALPYVSDGFKAHRCGYSDSPYSGPCGGIKVDIEDLLRWVMAMARDGVSENGERLCSEEQYAQIIAPVIPTPEENMFRMQGCCYAQAWHTGVYNGQPVVFHSGGLEGFNTQVGFLPGKNCGYAAIFNTGSTPAAAIVRDMALDTLTDGKPQDDYGYMIDEWKTRRDRMLDGIHDATEGDPIFSDAECELLGTYWHPAYETFVIENRDGHLWFTYGSFVAPLTHRRRDGRICGYTGTLDGLVPDHVELFPDGRDLRLRTSDSDLRMLFKRV